MGAVWARAACAGWSPRPEWRECRRRRRRLALCARQAPVPAVHCPAPLQPASKHAPSLRRAQRATTAPRRSAALRRPERPRPAPSLASGPGLAPHQWADTLLRSGPQTHRQHRGHAHTTPEERPDATPSRAKARWKEAAHAYQHVRTRSHVRSSAGSHAARVASRRGRGRRLAQRQRAAGIAATWPPHLHLVSATVGIALYSAGVAHITYIARHCTAQHASS